MKIVFAPDWFLGSDVLIDGFSFVILLAFFILAYRNYKMSKNKSTLYLGFGFLLIAFAELATILTKVVLYYNTSFVQQVGQMIVTYDVLHSVDVFYYTGFFFHKLLTLLGLYVIYRLPLKKKSGGDVILGLFFLVVSALFSNTFYYLFHITALILLLLIMSNYYDLYKKNKFVNTKIALVAFGMLALSQLIFIMSNLKVLYVLGQVIQLVSYLILLILILRILYYGRKKEKQN